MLVAADLQRPAAIEQLQTLGERVGVPVFTDRTQRPARLVRQRSGRQPGWAAMWCGGYRRGGCR